MVKEMKSKRKLRINANTNAFVIEELVETKKGEIWQATKWFTTLSGAAMSLRDYKLRSLINQGDEILAAINQSTKEVLELLKSDRDKKFIEICNSIEEKMEGEDDGLENNQKSA